MEKWNFENKAKWIWAGQTVRRQTAAFGMRAARGSAGTLRPTLWSVTFLAGRGATYPEIQNFRF